MAVARPSARVPGPRSVRPVVRTLSSRAAWLPHAPSRQGRAHTACALPTVGAGAACCALPAAFTVYACAVALARHSRSRARAALDPEDDDDRLELLRGFAGVDMPWLWRTSLEFALFRSYAIPAVSASLVASGGFEADAAVRYDDTDLLLREMAENGECSARHARALARMNAIHAARARVPGGKEARDAAFRYVVRGQISM